VLAGVSAIRNKSATKVPRIDHEILGNLAKHASRCHIFISNGGSQTVAMSYDPRKAAQTIAYFAMKNGRHPLNIVKAVKLVYLADRESVSKTGFPIQDEPRVSMKHGPVNSKTYSFINGEYEPVQCGWSEFLSDRSNHRIGLARADLSVDDLDELSDADIQTFDDVWDKFGRMNQWDLVEWTHKTKNVPEWENPGNSSFEIPIERMMRALSIQDASEQAELVKSLEYAKNIVKRL